MGEENLNLYDYRLASFVVELLGDSRNNNYSHKVNFKLQKTEKKGKDGKITESYILNHTGDFCSYKYNSTIEYTISGFDAIIGTFKDLSGYTLGMMCTNEKKFSFGKIGENNNESTWLLSIDGEFKKIVVFPSKIFSISKVIPFGTQIISDISSLDFGTKYSVMVMEKGLEDRINELETLPRDMVSSLNDQEKDELAARYNSIMEQLGKLNAVLGEKVRQLKK